MDDGSSLVTGIALRMVDLRNDEESCSQRPLWLQWKWSEVHAVLLQLRWFSVPGRSFPAAAMSSAFREGIGPSLHPWSFGVWGWVTFGSGIGGWSVFSYSGAEIVPCDVVPIPEVEVETAAL